MAFHWGNRAGWMRVFGFGMYAKDTARHPLLFSERYGYKRGLAVGRWWIGLLGWR